MSTARETAMTIKRQMGVAGLAVVGASDLAFTHDGNLTFKARLHFKDQTRVRVTRVEVSLNAMDLYDIHVIHTQRQAKFENIYAEDLTSFMYRLDAEGF